MTSRAITRVIQRAIFVLSDPNDGQRYLQALPDIQDMGLEEAVILHLLPGKPGPAEPMPELANWVRHFEAALPRVELALKRGDTVRWISELARIRDVQVVAISAAPKGNEWDIERVSSPLRSLGIPILYIPPDQTSISLSGDVLLAVKAPSTLEDIAPDVLDLFGGERLSAVYVGEDDDYPGITEVAGISFETVRQEVSVADTLLAEAERRRATLIAILTGEKRAARDTPKDPPVVKPLVEGADRPVLIWPAEG